MKWRVVVVRMRLLDTWHYRNKHAMSSSIRLGLIVALASILFDQALLAEGGHLEDPASYVKRLNELLLTLTK